MAEGWRLEVDRSRCVGSTICISTAPGVFLLREDGQSRAVRAEVAPDARILRAAELCPVEAISVIDGASGELIAPGDD
ncbi:ferredoxin [Streptomyces bohaiensis]|uniref:Ferredoxin n=1 Tax=Streptomyces bohaiensis TaxID=1431344 RepID=A0ABX1CBX9_9ACTN|nr:ferredoxin [Streptomyces bohaiensis]NJQ13819.1 ferredoxin [Streptomyces bohaiensis]